MFEDFLKLSYDKEHHKRRKLREMINRIDIPNMVINLANLDGALNRLSENINAISKKIEQISEEPTPEPEDLPDLIIDSIIPTDMGHYWDFAITVKNIGDAVAGASFLNAVIAGRSNVTLSIPSLEINETATVHTQVSYDPDSTESETKTMMATVDSTNIVNEKIEQNNTKQVQILLKGTYIPPSGKAYVIIHKHNPEGYETISLLNAGSDRHYHAIPEEINIGLQTISVNFNGINLEQTINAEEGHTYELFFIFPRTEIFLTNISCVSEGNVEGELFDVNISGTFGTAGNMITTWSVHRQPTLPHSLVYEFNHSCLFNLNSFSLTSTGSFIPIGGAYTNDSISIKLGNYLTNINIPININFSDWYAQGNVSGEYPQLLLNKTPNPFPYLPPTIYPRTLLENKSIYPYTYDELIPKEGYSLRAFSASYNWNSLRAVYTNSVFFASAFTSASYPTLSCNLSASGTLNEFHISSIPYALRGDEF